MGHDKAEKTGAQERERPASTDIADVIEHHDLMSTSSAKHHAPKQRHDYVREITGKRGDGHYTIITISKQADDHVVEDSYGYIHNMLGAQFRVAAVTEYEVTGIVHIPANKLNLDDFPTAVLSPSRMPSAGAPVELKGDKGISRDTQVVAHAYWFDDDTGRFGFTIDKGASDGIQAGMQGTLQLPGGDPHNYGPFTVVSVGPDESRAVTVATYGPEDYEYIKEKIVHNHSAVVHPSHKAHHAAAHKPKPERKLEF